MSLLTAVGTGPARIGALTATMLGTATGRAAAAVGGTLRDVPLRDVQRVDPAENAGWWARDVGGQLWHVAEDGRVQRMAEGMDPAGMLATGHGRVAGRGRDGRLWVLDLARPRAGPARSEVQLAPHGGLCILPLAVIAVAEPAGRHVLVRCEEGQPGRWLASARSREAVLPDAVPVVVDLDGRSDGGHIAVLAGPDAQRYPHAVLGDDVEATRVIWLERHSLEPLRALDLDAPDVFEDRYLRPWRLPDGRTGLVTVLSGPSGARMAVLAASRNASSTIEIAFTGSAIGTRNRWLSPASVTPGDEALWAVHTPHIGGVLHRYRPQGTALVSEVMATGVSNHRLGARDLDVSARVGPWLLVPTQDGHQARAVNTATATVVPVSLNPVRLRQWVASQSRRSAVLLTASGLAIWTP